MANAGIIDSMFIALGLDPGDAEKALDRFDKQMSDTFKKMPDTVDKSLSQVDNSFKNVFGGIMRNVIAPLTAALSVKALFGSYLKGADALGKAADRLGVNGEALHAWSEAAARAGGSSEAFQGSLKQLNQGVQEFKTLGEGRSKKVLEAMGFTQASFDAAKGGTSDIFDVLTKLSEKAETMDKMQFNAFASRLGIDQGTISLLQQGSKGLEEAIQRQKELGTYSERDMEITARFNKTLADMKQAFQSAAAIVLRVVVPVLTFLSEKLTKGISFMRKHEPFVVAFFSGLAIVLTAMLLPAIKKVQAAFMSWLTNPVILGAALLITGIALVIDDLITYIRGGNSALESFWKKFGTAEEVAKKLSKAWGAFRREISLGIDLLKSVISVIAELVTNTLSHFKGIIDPIVTLFKGAIGLISGIWIGDWEKVGEALYNILSGTINLIIELIKGVFTAVWNEVKAVWGKIKGLFGKKDNGAQGDGQSAEESWYSKLAKGFSNASNVAIEAGKAKDRSAAAAVKPSSVTNNSKMQSTSETHIGQITVTTQATDAKGIAGDIGTAMQERLDNQNTVNLVNSGTVTK